MPRSERRCPVVRGATGAVAAAHPLAVRAATDALAAGGSAVDAAISAQAVVCVVMPHAAGVGGDLMALVREPGGAVVAVNGTGCSPAALPETSRAGDLAAPGPGSSVTVPGIVDGWLRAHRRWGRMPLDEVLAPAVRAAAHGVVADAALLRAVDAHRGRLMAGDAASWQLLELSEGELWHQPALGDLLTAVAADGEAAFYRGTVAAAVVEAVQDTGGSLSLEDLRDHQGEVLDPIAVDWRGGRLNVQPPSSQGVLLALAVRWLARAGVQATDEGLRQHLLVELTEAVFAYRDSCSAGVDLFATALDVDPERAARRGGPRPYLHTAGVAVADADAMVVSSLVSVFDDFGSAVFVPAGGFTLNNRADGFTQGRNARRPSARPVHTLAPALLIGPDGSATALATPGADGQVQTLLQLLDALERAPGSVADTISAALEAPRWRSELGNLLLEEDHPQLEALAGRGHQVRPLTPGEDLFGAVVCAGVDAAGPFAAADWRRSVRSGGI